MTIPRAQAMGLTNRSVRPPAQWVGGGGPGRALKQVSGDIHRALVLGSCPGGWVGGCACSYLQAPQQGSASAATCRRRSGAGPGELQATSSHRTPRRLPGCQQSTSLQHCTRHGLCRAPCRCCTLTPRPGKWQPGTRNPTPIQSNPPTYTHTLAATASTPPPDPHSPHRLQVKVTSSDRRGSSRSICTLPGSAAPPSSPPLDAPAAASVEL